MSSKLKEEYAIQPKFLIFQSIDGNPVMEVYPPWGFNNKEECQEKRSQHLYGKLIENNARDKQYCMAHVITILKSIDIEFAKRVFNLLDPVSLSATPQDGRTEKGYGMHSALFCGMTVDYHKLIDDVLKIKEAQENNPSTVEQLKQLFVLELKQANYIGSILYAPTNVTAAMNNAVKEMTAAFHLTEAETKQLSEVVDEYFNKAFVCLKTDIGNATRLIESGKFAMPRDDEAIHNACIEYPKVACEEAIKKYQSAKSSFLFRKEQTKPAIDVAKSVLNDIISNFFRAISIPAPNASDKEFALSPLIIENEAQEIVKNVQKGRPCPNVANPSEVASTYNAYKALGNI